MHLADHHEFDGRMDKAQVYEVEMLISPKLAEGQWWIEAGPVLPEGVEVVEGPLVPASKHRCRVSLVVDGKARAGPGDRFVELRAISPDDDKLLEAVRDRDLRASDACKESVELLRRSEEEAQKRCNMNDHEKQMSTAAFLAANYTKKSNKVREEALFPEMQKEIAKGRDELTKDVFWPEQESEAYREEVIERAKPFMNPKLKQHQTKSFISMILRPFSFAF